MPDRVVSVRPDQSLPDVAKVLVENDLPYLLVIDDSKTIGTISDRDIVRGIALGSNHLTARDIMKDVSSHLENQDVWLKTVIENSDNVLFVLNRSSQIIYSSPSVSKTLGYSSRDLLGQPIFSYVHPEDRDLLADNLKASLGKPNETLVKLELRLVSHHNKWNYFQVFTTNLFDHSTIRGIVINCQDITQLKDRERQLQQHQIITELVQMLYQSSDLAEIFTVATNRLRELVSVHRATITQFHPDLNCWTPICESRLNETIPSALDITISAENNPISDRLLCGQTVKITDASCLEDKTNQRLAVDFPGAWLVVPIVVKGKVWGVVSLDFHRQTYEWQTEDVNAAELAVKQLAIAIEHFQLFEEIANERQALAEREERLRLILKLNKFGTWDWNLVENKVTWSAEKYELLGLDPNISPSYEAFISLVVPEQRPEIEAQIQNCISNHSTYYHETKIITPDGEERWLKEQGKCEVKDGQVIRMLGICEDITQKKQQEEIIKQVALSASVLIYIYDLEEERNIFMNSEVETLLGYSPAEIQAFGSQLIPQLVHPEDLPAIQTYLSGIITATRDDQFELECRLKDKQGNWHWLISRDRVIKRNKQGYPKLILGVATDITRIKVAETALQQINQQLEQRIADRTRTLEEQLKREFLLRTILENIHHSIDLDRIFYIILNETRLTFDVDRVAIYQFQLDGSCRCIFDDHRTDLSTIKGCNSLEDVFLTQLKTGSLTDTHVIVINDVYASVGRNVEILPNLIVTASLVTPIYLKDKLWGAIVVYEHCKKRQWELWEINLIQQIAIQTAIAIQQAELYAQLKSELQQKNILLKEVHHRVKNNLQIMSSLLRIQFRHVEPEIRDMLEVYQTRIQAMALVHDQLYLNDNFACINLQSYFTKLGSYLLQTYTTDMGDIKLLIDAGDISLPLENLIPLGLLTNELITNAIKYAFPSQKGIIKLSIVKKREMLELNLSDNGIGIDQDIDSLRGLGMQLVKTLVDQLDGSLTYENNNGSNFRIVFPL
jgi:PAS domain S-box-containing protein